MAASFSSTQMDHIVSDAGAQSFAMELWKWDGSLHLQRWVGWQAWL